MQKRLCQNLLDVVYVTNMLEIEKEFLEHCSSHRFSPPDDLVADLC